MDTCLLHYGGIDHAWLFLPSLYPSLFLSWIGKCRHIAYKPFELSLQSATIESVQHFLADLHQIPVLQRHCTVCFVDDLCIYRLFQIIKMIDSYRPKKWRLVQDTAEHPRSYDRRHREQSSPQHGYHSRSPSTPPWYEGSYYRPSPELRPRERWTTTTITITTTTTTTTSTSTLATQPVHAIDERRYLPQRTTPHGGENEGKRPRSPRDNGSRRKGSRRCRSRSRSPLRAMETYRRWERTPRRFQSRSPGRSRDSGPASGSHYEASLANPARTVKTSKIGSGRRKGLRNGEVQPQNDKERRWIAHQLRLKDLVAGWGEPLNSREADHIRQYRTQAVEEPAGEKKTIEERFQAMKLEEPAI